VRLLFPRPNNFQNKLLETLAVKDPQINPSTVLGVGPSNIQQTFRKDLPAIDASYMEGLHMAFAFAIALGGASILVAAAQPWFRLQVTQSADDREANKTKENEKVDTTISAV
jgi:hypothetical protein